MLEELLSRLDTGKKPKITELYLEDILPNPNQPRRYFDKESLYSLSDSIKEYGVIQPITVRRAGSQYEIIAGERRYRAAYIAGLDTIPAIIINADDDKSAVIALIENLQREDLCFFETAQSFAELIGKFSLTQEELAKRLGISRSAVANKIRLLKLPPRVQKLVRDYKLSERHARALLSVEGEEEQIKAAMKICSDSMSAQQAEAYIRGITQPRIKSNAPRASQTPDIRFFTNTIKRAMDSMKKNGLNAQMKQNESEDGIEYIITVKK